MKKVLFYIRSYFGGGAERVLIEYAKLLDKEKYDVTIMVRRKQGDFRDKFLALQDYGVHLRECCDYLTPGKNILQRLYNVVLSRMADFSEFRFPSIFYRIAIREKFDVEIAFMHNEAAAIIASSSNKKSQKFLWVHTDLRKIDSWKLYFKTRKRQRRFFNKFDHCICVSNYVADALNDLLGINRNVKVIYNPIDYKRILSLSIEPCQIDYNKKFPIICAVGRLSWEKNFQMLIQVHAELISEGYLHTLCIVGGGPLESDLKALIKELNVADTVILTGFKSNPYPYIQQADFLVCSSVYEGLPVVSQEAIILGKPIVSCCSVVQETFGEYNCGIITENNKEDFKNGIVKMLKDKTFFYKCKSEAEKRGIEYQKDISVKQIESLIDNF